MHKVEGSMKCLSVSEICIGKQTISKGIRKQRNTKRERVIFKYIGELGVLWFTKSRMIISANNIRDT